MATRESLGRAVLGALLVISRSLFSFRMTVHAQAGDPSGRHYGHGQGRRRERRGKSESHGSDGHRRPQQDLDQHRVDAARGLPRHVHAGGLRAGRDGPDPRQERRPHDGDELPRLRDRHARLLGLGFALQMGGVGALAAFGGDATPSQRVHGHLVGKDLRPVRHEGLLPDAGDVYTRRRSALFLFQMVFMDTTATIPTGAMAERWKFSSFVIFSFVIVDDHLPDLRATGSGAAAGCRARHELRPRPRPRRFRRQLGRAHDRRRCGARRARTCSARASASTAGRQADSRSPATTSRWRVLGTFILAFGWFGFNAGLDAAGTDRASRSSR